MRKTIEYFIKYPVAVNVMLIAIALFGIGGLARMNSSYFPLFPSETITISVTYPGASPEEIEEGVVLKIEDNLRGLLGVDRVTSVSSENRATITVERLDGYDIDVLLADVKNAVDRVPSFPVDMEPAIIAKQEPLNLTVSFTISGEGASLKGLKQISRRIEDDLRALGITQIQTTGYPAEEIEIAGERERPACLRPDFLRGCQGRLFSQPPDHGWIYQN